MSRNQRSVFGAPVPSAEMARRTSGYTAAILALLLATAGAQISFGGGGGSQEVEENK